MMKPSCNNVKLTVSIIAICDSIWLSVSFQESRILNKCVLDRRKGKWWRELGIW